MTGVGTVNPGLTLALVLLFLALVVAVMVLASLLSRARTQIYAANREVARMTGRQKAAQERAREAEEQVARLFHVMEIAVATAKEAVSTKDQLELVGQKLGELFACITEPLAELPPAGTGPALTGQYPAGRFR